MSVLVQETSGSTTTTSLTLTLPAPTTIGNALVLAVCGFRGSTISAITLGGTGNLFSEAVSTTANENAQIWWCTPVGVSSNTIVITAGAAGILAWLYELNAWSLYTGPVQPLFSTAWTDQTVSAFATTGTSWASGTTAATLGAAEFVVGIGATNATTTATVTGPASGGWTNEAAINGVHAGTRFYSGISGYQVQGTTSGTYDYSGTVSASSGWGACTATFLTMPLFDNWGGYIFSEHDSYTGISATFTVPSLSGETGSAGSIWVGLGDVYQTGVNIIYDTSLTGNVASFGWTEFVGGSGTGPFENWDSTAYPIAAGDSITATVQLTSANWAMTLANNTKSWTHTETRSVLAVNIGQLANPPSGPAVWPYPLSTAEVIIEDEGDETSGGSNPDYGSVAFTNISTTPPVSQAPAPWATVNTSIDQYPGPYNLAAGSFTMFWNGFT